MQSRIPLINPLDLDSPLIQGMGHDMLEEVENKALEDTNMGTIPVFPMRPGYDSNLIFGVVGKPMPNDLIQWLKAQKGRIPYVVKVGQGIANRVQGLVYANIPSISLPQKIDESIKVADKIDFQLEDSKPVMPIEDSNSNSGGSVLNKIKDKAKSVAKEQTNKLVNKVKDSLGGLIGKNANGDGEQNTLEYAVSLNKNRKL